MNSQFSQRVSDVLTYSKEEANRLGCSLIAPEHLLLGILRDGGGKAMEVLMKLDADVNRIALSRKVISCLRQKYPSRLLLPESLKYACSKPAC